MPAGTLREFDHIEAAKQFCPYSVGDEVFCPRYHEHGDLVAGLNFEVVSAPANADPPIPVDDGAYHKCATQNCPAGETTIPMYLKLIHNGTIDASVYGVRYGEGLSSEVRIANVNALNGMAQNSDIRVLVVTGDIELGISRKGDLQAATIKVHEGCVYLGSAPKDQQYECVVFNHDTVFRSGDGGPYCISLKESSETPLYLTVFGTQKNVSLEVRNLIFDTDVVNHHTIAVTAEISDPNQEEGSEENGEDGEDVKYGLVTISAPIVEDGLFLVNPEGDTDKGTILTVSDKTTGVVRFRTYIAGFHPLDLAVIDSIVDEEDKKKQKWTIRALFPKGDCPNYDIPEVTVKWERVNRLTKCIRMEGSYPSKVDKWIHWKADGKTLTGAKNRFLYLKGGEGPDDLEGDYSDEPYRHRRMTNGWVTLDIEYENNTSTTVCRQTIQRRIMSVGENAASCTIDCPIPVRGGPGGKWVKPEGTSTSTLLEHYFKASFVNVQIKGTFRTGIHIMGGAGEVHVIGGSYQCEESTICVYTTVKKEKQEKGDTEEEVRIVRNRYLYVRDTEFVSAGTGVGSRFNKHPHNPNGVHLYSDSNHSHVLDNVRFFTNERMPFKIEDGKPYKGLARFAVYNKVYVAPSRSRGTVRMPKLDNVTIKISDSTFNCHLVPTGDMQIVNTTFHNGRLYYAKNGRGGMRKDSSHKFVNCTFSTDNDTLIRTDDDAPRIGRVSFLHCDFTSSNPANVAPIRLTANGLFEFKHCDFSYKAVGGDESQIFLHYHRNSNTSDIPASGLVISGGSSFSDVAKHVRAHGNIKIVYADSNPNTSVHIKDHDFSKVISHYIIMVTPPKGIVCPAMDNITVQNCVFPSDPECKPLSVYRADKESIIRKNGLPFLVLPEGPFTKVKVDGSVIVLDATNLFQSRYLSIWQAATEPRIQAVTIDSIHIYPVVDDKEIDDKVEADRQKYYPLRFTPLIFRTARYVVFTDAGNIRIKPERDALKPLMLRIKDESRRPPVDDLLKAGKTPAQTIIAPGEYFQLIYRPERDSLRVWDIVLL